MQRRGDVASRVVDGEVVIFDAESSNYLTVAGAGVVLWEALSDEQTVSDLVGMVTDAFEVEEEVARRDVETFLQSLTELGLLREVPDS